MNKFLVAVELFRGTKKIKYYREGNKITSEEEPYESWFLLPEKEVERFPFLNNVEVLEGDCFNRLCKFSSWKEMMDAYERIKKYDGNILCILSKKRQMLSLMEERLFKGAKFDDVVRLIVDIETTGLQYQNSEILMIAMMDNRGNEWCLFGDERQMLYDFIKIVKKVNPDTIEGHNIFNFDIPFIKGRADLHNVRLVIGRDGSEIFVSPEQREIKIGANTKSVTTAVIHGRHILDTYIAVQKYDITAQKLTSYGLKAVARDFGIAEEDRVELPREKMFELWNNDKELVKLYALQDVRETKKLAEIVCPMSFFTVPLVPFSYYETAITGNGQLINSILVSEYLRRGKSIPFPAPFVEFEGAHVEVFKIGVVERIVKADVESLYPSLMLTRGIKPQTDTENLLLPLLKKLKDGRIENKRKVKSSTTKEEKDYWDGLQSAQKILINSMYGFMGASQFNFSDMEAASKVTEGGREIIGKIIESAREAGCEPIEADTDGLMFVPPIWCDTEEKELELVNQIGKVLPEGIILAHDGRYAKMISLRMKNYVLLDYDGHITFKGAALKSRGVEPYGMRFIEDCIRKILDNDIHNIKTVYYEYLENICHGNVDISLMARRERISDKVLGNDEVAPSNMKKRLRELAIRCQKGIGDYLEVYEKQDGTLQIKEEFAKDLNVLYYADKLFGFAERLSPVLEETLGYDYIHKTLSKPNKRNLAEFQGTQLTLFS